MKLALAQLSIEAGDVEGNVGRARGASPTLTGAAPTWSSCPSSSPSATSRSASTSAWPYPRVEHWGLLPRARAVENQCYVATGNRAASFDEATLPGRSTVFGPWGTIPASSDDDPTPVAAEGDPDRVEAIREEFPALRGRRA